MANTAEIKVPEILNADAGKLLRNMLRQHTTGEDYAAPFLEAVANSFDARASEVFIKMITHNKKPAICIVDTGDGFSAKGLYSALTYHESVKQATDRKTIGKNGTGLKSLLALGPLEKTRVEIYTMSQDYPEGVMIGFDFEYLVSLYQVKEVAMRDQVHPIVDRGIFYQGLKMYKGEKRVSGSTIIITGFDEKKITSNHAIAQFISSKMNPRAAGKVKVWNGKEYQTIKIPTPSGELFAIDFFEQSTLLGNVNVEVYYNGSNDGPLICGELNSLMRYRTFLEGLSPKERKSIPKVLGSVGGFIYMSAANQYRGHDGTFEEEFRTSGALHAFLEILKLVGEEIAQLQETAIDSKRIHENIEMLKLIAKISEPEKAHHSFPFGKKATGERTPLQFGSVDMPQFIVPRKISMYQNASKSIKLQNLGTEEIDFTAAQWSTDIKRLMILGNGDHVAINALRIGTTKITVTGHKSKFTHEIDVVVKEKPAGAYIDGPGLLNPGSTETYILENSEIQLAYKWEITKAVGVSIVSREKEVEITVAGSAPIQSFELFALTEKGKTIAKKKIRITDKSGNRPIVTRIGEQDYILVSSVDYPGCAVQFESADEEMELPMLHVNPNHGLLKNCTKTEGFLVMANGLASAAIAHQTSNGLYGPEKAMTYFWEYLEKVRNSIGAVRRRDS